MAADTLRHPAPILDVATISKALDGLLRAILDAEAAERAARAGPRRFEILSVADLRDEALPNRAESAIKEMARDPIGGACRAGIRACGEALHRLGGFALMSKVIEDVADLDPPHYGARLTILDHGWNGIADEWWS